MRNDKHLTDMVYEWEYIPVLAAHAVKHITGMKPEDLTPDWCKEAFFQLVVDDVVDPEGILNNIVDYAVTSINWYRVSEAVKNHIYTDNNNIMRVYVFSDNSSKEELTEQISFTDALLLAETYVKADDTDVRVHQYAREGFNYPERSWMVEEFLTHFTPNQSND